MSKLEHALGEDSIAVATSLKNLGLLYRDEGRYADAELSYKRALALREKLLGPDHPFTGALLNDLAESYYLDNRYPDALAVVKRAVQRWSHFVTQPAKVDLPMQRMIHHEDAETVFG